MMKKFLERNSYVIILIAASMLLFFVAAAQLGADKEEYMRVEVKEGQSLWQIASELSEVHGFDKKDFIRWVEKENGIAGGRIAAGEQLIVPIAGEDGSSIQLASAD